MLHHVRERERKRFNDLDLRQVSKPFHITLRITAHFAIMREMSSRSLSLLAPRHRNTIQQENYIFLRECCIAIARECILESQPSAKTTDSFIFPRLLCHKCHCHVPNMYFIFSVSGRQHDGVFSHLFCCFIFASDVILNYSLYFSFGCFSIG